MINIIKYIGFSLMNNVINLIRLTPQYTCLICLNDYCETDIVYHEYVNRCYICFYHLSRKSIVWEPIQ